MIFRRIARAGAGASLILLGVAGCRGPTDNADGVCPQTYEFANPGCLEVRGVVVGMRGQPLPGISVVSRSRSTQAGFAASPATTDATGSYRLRLMRMAGARPKAGPDTASVYVVATDRTSVDVGAGARIRDSVLVLGTIAPVGQVPTPSQVRVVLPVP